MKCVSFAPSEHASRVLETEGSIVKIVVVVVVVTVQLEVYERVGSTPGISVSSVTILAAS